MGSGYFGDEEQVFSKSGQPYHVDYVVPLYTSFCNTVSIFDEKFGGLRGTEVV